jgi:hypothetical protein
MVRNPRNRTQRNFVVRNPRNFKIKGDLKESKDGEKFTEPKESKNDGLKKVSNATPLM